ncbi:hypothetical protein [Lentibacillus daqui]|uniref:hypothetical protein n=1 Tax=Lentibacillus daqui TaxID=2911514 RepID=UPI0022B1F861|nr:hypothetical protein [Lentibacillus daqui]
MVLIRVSHQSVVMGMLTVDFRAFSPQPTEIAMFPDDSAYFFIPINHPPFLSGGFSALVIQLSNTCGRPMLTRVCSAYNL